MENEKQDEKIPEVKVKMRKVWKERTTSSKAGFISSLVILGLCVISLILIIFCRQIFGDEVGDSILGKGVPNGFVAMWNAIVSKTPAVIGTVIALFVTILVVFLLNFLVNILAKRSKRGKTIASLIKSLIKYIAVVVCFCVILSLWGVNVAGIVAGVGILTLIIGLGCQSLVNDIVSGIFIVCDNYFEVGDTVIIDGFRGTIVSIGLRTTKIRDYSNNIKSIANSTISTVVNVSRYNSNVYVYMEVSFNEDLHRVEAVVNKAFPEMKKKIPGILTGPIYKGVSKFTECGVELYFFATSSEDDRFQIERDLRRELYLLFKENNIIIPFKQVVVNPPDPNEQPRATVEERKVSDDWYKEAHGVNVTNAKKKKTFSDKIKKAYENAASASDEDQ